MNLSWSTRMIKYLLFIFNFLFVLTGIIILVTGASIKGYYYNYDTFLDEKYFSLPNLLIAIGSIIFIISIFGCLGAKRESWVLVLIFACLLILIFILEMAGGIAGYVLRDDTAAYLDSKLLESLKKYKPNNTTSKDQMTMMWDKIQENFECCGVTNSSNWQQNKDVKNLNGLLPLSCCKMGYSLVHFACSLNETVENSEKPYNIGCEQAFGDFVRSHAATIGGMGIAIAVIQFVGIIFACHLARQLKYSYYST